jgi:hypothetical protein
MSPGEAADAVYRGMEQFGLSLSVRLKMVAQPTTS